MPKDNDLRYRLDLQLFADDIEDPDDDMWDIDPDDVGESQDEDGDKETSDGAEEAEEGKKKPQSREENAKFAEARRKAEKAAKKAANEKALKEAYDKGRIEGIGGVNPYIGKKIENEYDLHLYDLMKKADEDGDDPLKTALNALASEEAERSAKAKQEKERSDKDEQAKRQRIQDANKLISDLEKAHPECDRAWFKKQWEENPRFKDYIAKHNFTPLEAAEMLNLVPDGRKDKTPSSTPSGNTAKKSVKDMTDEEYIEYRRNKYGSF